MRTHESHNNINSIINVFTMFNVITLNIIIFLTFIKTKNTLSAYYVLKVLDLGRSGTASVRKWQLSWVLRSQLGWGIVEKPSGQESSVCWGNQKKTWVVEWQEVKTRLEAGLSTASLCGPCGGLCLLSQEQKEAIGMLEPKPPFTAHVLGLN